MSEENTGKQEGDAPPVAAAPPPAAEEKAAAEAAPPEAAPSGEGKRKKKIRRMSPDEVEKALARSRTKMGKEASLYVKHLLVRKAELEAKKK